MNPNNLDAVKSTTSNIVLIGDTINYTVVLTNNGSVPDTNIILTDLIPQGADFVNNSIFINNTTIVNSNPALGVTIPDMPVGAINTVTFQAIVTNPPANSIMYNWAQIDYQYTENASVISASIDTNSVAVTNTQALLRLTKVAPTSVIVGQNLTFTITASNIGNTTATSIRFIDTIPVGTVFVTNSVTVSGVNQGPLANPSPPNGFGVSSINPFGFRTIAFTVNVVSLPPNNTIQNIGDSTYVYTSNNLTGATIASRVSSNITTTTVIVLADLKGITKSVDKAFATCGDTLNYTITIPNTSSVTVTNVIITDTLSNGLSYVPGSLFINSVPSGNSLTSINVGTIPPGTTSTVTFNAKVNC